MTATVTDDKRAAADHLDLLDRYWRAANYLSVGQIYLMDNPLLREPLRPEHIKPRLLGHWGTTPGLNFIYAHLNRAICALNLSVIYVCGPGHGGPAMVAKPGVAQLATLADATVGAFYVHPERAWQLRSWDRFLIPKPFSRVTVAWTAQVPAEQTAVQAILDRSVELAHSAKK